MAPLKAATTASFNQIVKSPTTYMLVVAVSLLTFFVGLYRDSNNDYNTSQSTEITRLRAENAALKQENKEERKEKQDLVMALLVSKEVQKALSKANQDTLTNTPTP